MPSNEVWLLTRPLQKSILKNVSEERDHLRHWGVLVNFCSMTRIKYLLNMKGSDDPVLGTLYELRLAKGCILGADPLKLSSLKHNWPECSAKYIGKTEVTDVDIEGEGRKIINEVFKGKYRLIKQNCQEFAKQLLEFICPGMPTTLTTIQNYLTPWQGGFSLGSLGQKLKRGTHSASSEFSRENSAWFIACRDTSSVVWGKRLSYERVPQHLDGFVNHALECIFMEKNLDKQTYMDLYSVMSEILYGLFRQCGGFDWPVYRKLYNEICKLIQKYLQCYLQNIQMVRNICS